MSGCPGSIHSAHNQSCLSRLSAISSIYLCIYLSRGMAEDDQRTTFSAATSIQQRSSHAYLAHFIPQYSNGSCKSSSSSPLTLPCLFFPFFTSPFFPYLLKRQGLLPLFARARPLMLRPSCPRRLYSFNFHTGGICPLRHYASILSATGSVAFPFAIPFCYRACRSWVEGPRCEIGRADKLE